MTDQPSQPASEPPAEQPPWQPLPTIQRRVLGVLAEKAKTTPDAYPMSLNALVSGCNQKSNRAPVLNLDPERIEEALDRLRERGAVTLVEGGGRVSRYRHQLYQWLGVDKAELAVMTELLLRGTQTVGELRGRAARMEPIADLAALRPILDSLRAKRLVISLTPEGRGQVVTHALFEPAELEKQRAQYGGSTDGARPETAPLSAGQMPRAREESAREVQAAISPASTIPPAAAVESAVIEQMQAEIDRLRFDLDEVTGRLEQYRDELDQLKQQLGV